MEEKLRKTLFDEENRDNLLLDNGNGLVMSFGQVYATEREDGIYCILRPLDSVEGLSPRAALVFSVDDDGVFRAVKDKKISEGVFKEYYKAVELANRGE